MEEFIRWILVWAVLAALYWLIAMLIGWDGPIGWTLGGLVLVTALAGLYVVFALLITWGERDQEEE